MRKIELVDKTIYEAEDVTTAEHIVLKVSGYHEASQIEKSFSTENTKRLLIDEEEYLHVQMFSSRVEKNGETYTMSILCKVETTEEKAIRLALEAQQAVADLAESVLGGAE